MSEKNIFSIRMKEARQKVDMSQAELSRQTGIAPATLSSYETIENPKNPTIDKVILIAQTLNVSIDWLCGLEEKNTENGEIRFDEIMQAIILLSNLENTDFEYGTYSSIAQKSPYSIKFYDDVIIEFCLEYRKIRDFIKNSDYPQYLKDGLLKTLLDKFRKYIISSDGNVLDIGV